MRRAAGLDDNVVWYLRKMLPGQRAGGATWVKKATREFIQLGYERCLALPYFFHHRSTKVTMEMHMDDFHGTGSMQAVDTARIIA